MTCFERKKEEPLHPKGRSRADERKKRHCIQGEAAKHLGISATTLKKVCRKLGIERWPGPQRRRYRREPCDDGAVCSEPPAANWSLHSGAPPLGDIRTPDEKSAFGNALEFEPRSGSPKAPSDQPTFPVYAMQNGRASEVPSHDANFLDMDCGFTDWSYTVPAADSRAPTLRTLAMGPAYTRVASTSEISAFDAEPQVQKRIRQEVEDRRAAWARFGSVDFVPLLRDSSGPFRFICVTNHLCMFRMHHQALLHESYVSSYARPACTEKGRLQGASVRTILPVSILLSSLNSGVAQNLTLFLYVCSCLETDQRQSAIVRIRSFTQNHFVFTMKFICSLEPPCLQPTLLFVSASKILSREVKVGVMTSMMTWHG